MLHEKRRLNPPAMAQGSEDLAVLVDTYFNAYNAGRLREACQVFVKMVDSGATIGISLAGALTPAGLSSVLVPLLEAGMVDYISTTGANLYHDLHFDLDLPLYRGPVDVASGAADLTLRRDGIVRVYDVLMPIGVLYKTDEWIYRVLMAEEFNSVRLSSAALHYRIGRYAAETARKTGCKRRSLFAVCHDLEVPVYTPSPGDSTLGMNISALYTARPERGPVVDPAIDVCEMTSVVLDAKRRETQSGVVILGGGAPKNFLLQTEPQLQEVLGVPERGHDYFIQVTDARPDTGGLSGATPAEAVSWGKIDPDRLPSCVVCYLDSTVALPIIGSYVLARAKPRTPKRLLSRMPTMVERLCEEYRKSELFARYWGVDGTTSGS